MSKPPVFIEVPQRSLSFKERLRASFQTTDAFLRDQKAASLGLLVIFSVLLVWDFHVADFSILPERGSFQDKLVQWFPFMDSFLAAEAKLQASATWRASLAHFLLSLYGLNALIYIADHSPAFADKEVVGVVRLFFRYLGISLLMVIPAAISIVLLVVPFFIVLAVYLLAGTITIFKDQTPTEAIQTSYSLVTAGPAAGPRKWVRWPVFFNVMSIFLVDALLFVLLTAVNFGIYSFAVRWHPEYTMSLLQSSLVVTDLLGLIFGLVIQIFILRIFAEYRQYPLTSLPPLEAPGD